MNKTALVAEIAKKTGLTKKDSLAVLEVITGTIAESLSKGEPVQIIGFGSFVVRERAERKGRNPQTGEDIVIPATKTPAFKVGKLLKDVVK